MDFGEKANGISMGAAAKTVVELFFIIDCKGRGLFMVKGAETLIFTTSARQLDFFADNFRKGKTRAQGV